MSTPAVAKNLFAVIGGGMPVPSKPENVPVESPKRPFAQTPVLLNARQATSADNVTTIGVAKGNVPAGERAVPVVRVLPSPAPAKPLRAQDQKTQGLEVLTQAAVWDAHIRPTSARLPGGRLENTPALGVTITKGALSPERLAGSPSDRLPGAATHPVPRATADKTGREPSPAAAAGDGATTAKEKPEPEGKVMPPKQPVTGGTDRTTPAASGETVQGARKSQTPEKSVTPTNEQPPAALKHVETKAGAESNVQRAMESPKADVAGTLRHLQAVSERTGVPNDRLAAQTLPSVQQTIREVHSHGHPGPAPGDSTQGRRASSGTTLTISGSGKVESLADGERPNQRQITFEAVLHPEPVATGSDRPVIASQPVSHHGSMAGNLEGTAAKGLTQSIGEQIRDSMQTSLARGDREVVIRLHPPELGSVVVRFGEEDGQIHGVLEVSRGETRHEVEQALPEVLRSLQELGSQVRRIEVTVSDPAEKDMGRQQLQQDASPQQQDSGRYTRPPNSEFQGSNFEAEKMDAATPTTVSAGRIDMLI